MVILLVIRIRLMHINKGKVFGWIYRNIGSVSASPSKFTRRRIKVALRSRQEGPHAESIAISSQIEILKISEELCIQLVFAHEVNRLSTDDLFPMILSAVCQHLGKFQVVTHR